MPFWMGLVSLLFFVAVLVHCLEIDNWENHRVCFRLSGDQSKFSPRIREQDGRSIDVQKILQIRTVVVYLAKADNGHGCLILIFLFHRNGERYGVLVSIELFDSNANLSGERSPPSLLKPIL